MTVWFHLCLLSILKTKLSKPAFFHACFTGGMKNTWLFSVYKGLYYPVMWGLFHKHINHEKVIPINQPGFPMESKGPRFFFCVAANRPGFNRWKALQAKSSHNQRWRWSIEAAGGAKEGMMYFPTRLRSYLEPQNPQNHGRIVFF